MWTIFQFFVVAAIAYMADSAGWMSNKVVVFVIVSIAIGISFLLTKWLSEGADEIKRRLLLRQAGKKAVGNDGGLGERQSARPGAVSRDRRVP